MSASSNLKVPVGIFLDIPNICHNNHFTIEDINWQALLAHIAASLSENDVVDWAGAYMIGRQSRNNIANRLHGLARAIFGDNLDVYIRWGEDIDGWIITDLLSLPLRSLNRDLSGEFPPPLVVPLPFRFILVSGDSGYTRATRMLTQLNELITFNLEVWSWRGSLGHDLESEAHHVSLLDDIPDLLPPGRSPLRSGVRKK